MHGECKITEIFTDDFNKILLDFVYEKMLDAGFRGREFYVWKYLYCNSLNLKICKPRAILAKELDMNLCSIGAPLTKLKKHQYIKIVRRQTETGRYLTSEIRVTLPVSLIAELRESNNLIYQFFRKGSVS